MATITNKAGLVWLGENSDCKSLDVKDFAGKIRTVYTTTTGGVDYSDPLGAELGVSFSAMSCGSAYLIYSSSEGIPYEFESAIESNLDIDSGRLDLTSINLKERFVITNLFPDADGTYIMTTSFLNDKPIYRNQNDWYGMYNDDDTWSLKNKFTQHTLEYKNNDSNPSGGIYLETSGGNPGPVPDTPTPTPNDPVSIDVNILGRWDAQFASNSTLIEDPINSNDISVQPSVIKDDLSSDNRGKVFNMTQSAHYCKLGDILNETFHSENFSISLWCNPNTHKSLSQNSCCYLSSGGCADSCIGSILASKWVSSPSLYKNSWLIYSGGTFVSNGSLKAGENAPGTPNSTSITKSIPYNSDTWTHLLYSVNAGFVTIYMNGEDVTNPDHANIKHSFDLDCSRPIILGNIQTNSGYPSSKYGYWGSIDDFRVYEGPLSVDQVNAIYTENDTESMRTPFNIPQIDPVETELPMSGGIQKLEINNLIAESQIFAMDTHDNQLVIAISSQSDTMVEFKFYEINNDSSFTHIPEENSSAIIPENVIESVDDIEVLKFIRTSDQTRILLIWTHSSGLVILSDDQTESEWNTSVISVNMNTSIGNLEYVLYEDSTQDTILISDSGSLKSYRKDDFGFWDYVGIDSGVDNIALSNKKLTISRPGATNSNIFNLFIYDISNPDEIPGVKSYTRQLGRYSFQGSFDSENYALAMHGDEVYASFSGMQSNLFKFDPNDDFLPSASPSSICQFSDNLNFKENIFPPYRLSGIDYNHVHSFGYDIDINDMYLVATNKLCDFACLYKKTTTGTWTFMSRLVYGVVSASPKCYLGSDYCIIECGDGDTKKIVHFKITDADLQPTDKTLQIVNANLVAWWDFSGKYGKLPGSNHIVFDKSGYNNHLGIGGFTYEQTSTAEIPSALNSDKVYRFEESTSTMCKSPISTDTFSGEFTINVWIYRTEDHFPRRIVITKTNDIETNNSRTFALYSNGACDIDGVSLPAPLANDLPLNEWSFMTLVNNTYEVKFYLNGVLKFSKPKPTNSISNFTTKELQIAPHGDVGYLDDIKIYKKALNRTEIQNDFDKSYRTQFLATN